MKELTPKQQRFVDEYLVDLNGTQAAIRAGYAAKGADVTASKLVGNAKVDAAIQAGKRKRSEKTGIDAAWVLNRLAVEADADLADLYSKETGDLLPVHEWPKIWRQGLVAGVEVDALYDGVGKDRVQIGEVKKLKLSDRVRRLELIGKHVGVQAFKDQIEVGGLGELADRLARAKLRKAGA